MSVYISLVAKKGEPDVTTKPPPARDSAAIRTVEPGAVTAGVPGLRAVSPARPSAFTDLVLGLKPRTRTVAEPGRTGAVSYTHLVNPA